MEPVVERASAERAPGDQGIVRKRPKTVVCSDCNFGLRFRCVSPVAIPMPIGWQCVLASAQNIFRCTAVNGSRAASATWSLRDDDRIIRTISRQLNTA